MKFRGPRNPPERIDLAKTLRFAYFKSVVRLVYPFSRLLRSEIANQQTEKDFFGFSWGFENLNSSPLPYSLLGVFWSRKKLGKVILTSRGARGRFEFLVLAEFQSVSSEGIDVPTSRFLLLD